MGITEDGEYDICPSNYTVSPHRYVMDPIIIVKSHERQGISNYKQLYSFLQLVQVNNKEDNNKALHYWLFVGTDHQL